MDDFFMKVTGQEQSNDSCFPTLSLKERLIGFAVCFVLGMIIQFLSMGSLIGFFLGKTSKFAFLYTFGNIISIAGTLFLVGPKKQLENMSQPSRRWTSLIFVISMIMTLVTVYYIKSKILTIIFIAIQFCAYIWYVLSYIPFGRAICKKCLRGFWSSPSE